MKKCNGYGCTHTEACLHYKEYKKPTKAKGKWIEADRCINNNYREFESAK